VKVTWSAFALSDRDGIFSRIEAENAVAAIAVDQRIGDGRMSYRAKPSHPQWKECRPLLYH